MNIGFGEQAVTWHGRREKVAIVLLGGHSLPIGLADTARCAVSLESCERLLVNLSERVRVPTPDADATAQLQAHCRALTKWKERKPRY